jgi:hypothetical protein
VAGAYGWQPYYLHVPIVLKSRSLNLLEPSGPVQACTRGCFTLLLLLEGTQLPSSLFLKQKTNNRLFCRTMTVLVSAFLQIFFFWKFCLIGWLSLMSYILCLQPVMETLLCIVTVTDVCCGNRTLSSHHYKQAVTLSGINPLVFSFKRHCVLSWNMF